jgi:predicted dehydrogenase
VTVAATGFDHFQRGIENTAYVTVTFDNMIAHFNVNWLSPVKVRNTMIGGRSKMLVWDDSQADEKIRIYDKGVDLTEKSVEGVQAMKLNYRTGDAWIPRVDHTEALKLEAQYFVDCVRDNVKPFNGGEAGLRVVKLLAAADESLKAGGKEIKV